LPFLLSIVVYASSTIHGDMSEEKFQDASALEAWLKGKDVDSGRAATVSEALFSKGFDQPSTLIGISSAQLEGKGITTPTAVHISNKLEKEQFEQQQQQQDDDRRKRIADGVFYATSEELWDWKLRNWSGAMSKLRRAKPPDVYSDLAQAIEDSETSHSTRGDSLSAQTSLVTDVKVLNDAGFSIFGNLTCNKGHQIPKSRTCRPFYGLVAEIATGLNLSKDANRQEKWSKLLRGGKTKNGHGFVGLEKRAENLVMVNDPHREIYDILDKGVLAIIPICSAKFSLEWQQGCGYDLLVVADTAPTYDTLNINTGTRGSRLHRRASHEDITEATNFLGSCIKALAEILASESNMLLGPMEAFLDDTLPDGEQTKESNNLRTLMREKLEALKRLRSSLLDVGNVEVPSINPNIGKEVLKIHMETYMKISGVGELSSGDYPYPDPWLVGMKAAINSYFGHTKVKLHPACQPTPHDEDSDDEDSDDEDCLYLDVVHGSSPCVTGAAQYSSIQEEDFSFPLVVSIVSDDDDDTSVITDDGEYCALFTTGEQSVACTTPNQKLQGRDVTP